MRIFTIARQQRRAYWVGAAIGAVGSVLGGLLGRQNNSFDPYAALYTTQLQKDLFDYQWSKQLQAMNTAHQREVTDLRKAGLNPILSGTGGSGLNSPTSGMPDISSVNSAITTSRQADRQMKANLILGAVDRVLQYQSNKINEKSVDVNDKTANANLMNANTNAVNTASQVQQRNIQNSNISANTKKVLEEINLVKSQEALNSAYANQALTNSWYQREMLPWDQYAKGTSGSVAGTLSYPIKQVVNTLNEWRDKNVSSAREKNLNWLRKKDSGIGFLGK